MILQKKTINNVPTLVPLTADTGSGVPVGTIIGQYKKVNMAGYLYLDGSTFDQTLYPALYAYLGTNVLPDYREFVLVGAEQNTTSATIADHDVFTQGQEKDDQLQTHAHTFSIFGGAGSYGVIDLTTGSRANEYTNEPVPPFGSGITVRKGTTTRTKEKAVFWYIKATTGIIESEATEMLNVINEKLATKELTNITVANGYCKVWRSGNTVMVSWGTKNDASVTIPTGASVLARNLPLPKVIDAMYWNSGNPFSPMYVPGSTGVTEPDVTANVTRDGDLIVYNNTGSTVGGVYKGFCITYLTSDN